MSIKKYISLFLLPFIFFASCVDDRLIHGNSQLDSDYVEGTAFEIMVEDNAIRTRTVNFNEGAPVKINSVWMGVFDRESRACVARRTSDQKYLGINTGKDYTNVIRVELPSPEAPEGTTLSNKYFIVCVVNFQDINDQVGTSLKTKLENITSWNDFVDIAIETESAYTYPHESDSPLMAGFLRSKNIADRKANHVMVNQFDNNKLYPSPEDFDEDIEISHDGRNYEIGEKKVILRRLVSQVSVNIELLNSDIELTDVQYKRFNMPEYVYIIERRTVNNDDPNDLKVPIDVEHVANYADKLWVESNHEKGYKSDTEWQIENTNRNSSSGIWSFYFQHFANKHWARHQVISYNEREAHTPFTYWDSEPDPEDESKTIQVQKKRYLFNALVTSQEDKKDKDFNNNASYFTIKMHLIESKKNRCAEAEYTIHEGNTSDADGEEMPNKDGNLSDFVCARNISYLYNVKINGFKNIFFNVEGNGSTTETREHHPDQGGKVWQIEYANDIYLSPDEIPQHYFDRIGNIGHFEEVCPGIDRERYTFMISDKDGKVNYYCEYQNAIKAQPLPNMAFRLYGYTNYRTKSNSESAEDEGQVVEPGIAGYNYNFERSSFDNLKGIWPPSTGDFSRYFQNKESLNIERIPQDLRDGVLIKDSEDKDGVYMNLVQFINYADQQTTPKNYHVYIRKSELAPVEESQKDNYIRALYIADRNGIVDDVDGCSTKINVFCAAQFPPIEGVDYGDEENTNFVIPWKYNELTDLYFILYDYDMNLKGKYQFKGDYAENVWLTERSIEMFNDYYFIITDSTGEKIKLGSNGENISDRNIPYILKPGTGVIEYKGGRFQNIFSVVKDENGNYILYFRELT